MTTRGLVARISVYDWIEILSTDWIHAWSGKFYQNPWLASQSIFTGLTVTMTACTRLALDQANQNSSMNRSINEALLLDEQLLATDVWWGREKAVFFRNLAQESIFSCILSYITQIQAVNSGTSGFKERVHKEWRGKCSLIEQEFEKRMWRVKLIKHVICIDESLKQWILNERYNAF